MKRIILAAILLLPLVYVHGLNPTGFEQSLHFGHVYARAVVKDKDTGLPLWAEYNEQGGFTKLQGVDLALAADGKVVSGNNYRAYKASLQSFKEQYESKVDEYSTEDFLKEAPKLTTKDGIIITGWPTKFSSEILSIAIPAKEKRLQGNAAYIERLVFPVNLKKEPDIAHDTKSVLLDATGKILKESPDRIGLLSAFYVKKGEELANATDYDNGSTLVRLHDYDVLDPVAGVFIEGITGYINGADVSGSDGSYRLKMRLSPCPGFSYFPTTRASARLYYANFNPKGQPVIPYYIDHQSYDACNGMYLFLSGIPGAQGAALAVHGIVTGTPENITRLNYAVAINVLAGQVAFPGVEIVEDVTNYSAEQSPKTEYMATNDYDADGTIDQTIRGALNSEGVFEASATSPTYGVKLSGSLRADGQPNFTRVMDIIPELKHKGLLTKIATDDLINTDLYVFRESTGELITERKGVPTGDINRRSIGRVLLDDDNQFSYTMPFRSTEDNHSFKKRSFDSWQQWQVANQMSPALQEYKSDFLRNGEQLRVVAINRATGYIGTIITTLTAATDGGNITSPVKPIIMGPPNLKVWASRQVQPEGLLKGADKNRYTISNEGAAEVNDFAIEVHTQWLDVNGYALPAGLKGRGYTGRLVKVSKDPAGGGDVFNTHITEFPISPGRELQVVKFSEGAEAKYHYHLQVSGESDTGLADFTVKDLTGVLRHRPSKYVPLLVPIFNENATNQNRSAQIAKGVEEREVEAAFNWFYRPELSFSVVDLEVKSIKRVVDGKESQSFLDDEYPIIASSDDAIKFLFELTQSKLDRITPLDGDQEYILALGEEEISIKIVAGENTDKTVQFTNLEHLSKIEPEDFLTARIYLNQDSQNLLWEYAFDLLYLESATIGYKNQTESTYFVTADNPVVDLKAGIAGYAYLKDEDKYEPTLEWELDGTGNLKERIQESPNFATFDNTLTMPTLKGSMATVSATIRATQTTAKWKTVKVLAGEPNRIEVTQTGTAISLDQGEVTLDISVYDKYNNYVEDGTEIDVEFPDSLRIKDQSLTTENGKAFIRFSGGSFSSDDSIVTIATSDISVIEEVTVQSLNIEFVVAKSTLKKLETISVTAIVTKLDGSPAVNIPVSLSAGRGVFAEQNLITDSQGKVTTTFTAGLNEQEDTWTALAGYVASVEKTYQVVAAGPQSVNAQDTMLVADEIAAGVIEFDSYGVQTSLAYETQATVAVKGSIGDIITIGDMADPNLEPLLSLPLNQIDGTQVKDDHQINHGETQGVSIVYDHPLGAGRSAHFNTDSSITIPSSDLLSIKDQSGFRLDIKPLGNGDIVDYSNGALKLAYQDSVLTLSLLTTNGIKTVSAPNVTEASWHRVAANVQGQNVNLYVDGQLYTQNFTGSVNASTNHAIELGGLQARMRAFKVFDYGSAPLIAFQNGATQYTQLTAQEVLTVKSLGNLGKAVTSSKLQTHRVALISGADRNYASLLTKRGYQSIAQDYLYTASPQSPLALHSISNPLVGLVPTAHAWSWDGVWDGVKDTVGMLIPYEDFIIIAEQLTFLVNKDWKNFDPTALAFASLGAATILPVAKPLKPLLAPIKKFVDGMKRFPGARHFAGSVGTAVKSALSGKTDKIEKLLPFILIGMELYKDPEVFDFIMSTITNEDDLWMWVDYISTLVEVNGGLDTDDSVAVNGIEIPSMLAFVPQAYAKGRQQVAQDAIKIIKPLAKNIKDKKKFTSGLKSFLKEISKPENIKWKGLVKNGKGISYLTTLGGAKIRAFITNSKNWRVNRWVVLASLVYISEQVAEGSIEISKQKWAVLSADVFSGWAWRQHGAIFQLSQIAYYHLNHKYAEGPKILDIEALRPAYILANGVRPENAKPYNRRIDIVLEEPNGEKWVELKSLSGPFSANWFKPLLAGVSKVDETQTGFNAKADRSYFRQFFHDMRLNSNFIGKKSELILDDKGKLNNSYQWYFHDYKTQSKSVSPTGKDIKLAKDNFCKPPADAKPVQRFYKDNLSGTPLVITTACNNNFGSVTARNTKSYFSELLKKYASELEIEDFLTLLDELGIVE